LVSIRSAARRVGGEEVGGRHGVDDLLHGKGNLLFLLRRRFHGSAMAVRNSAFSR
jgi:hypothetical protein